MDPHRSFPDESEPRWYGGEQYPERGQYQDPDWDYRVPEPRGGAGGERFGPQQRYPVGPRSGEPLPPPAEDPAPRREPPPGRDPRAGHPPDDPARAGPRRAAGPAPAGDGVYRARRPAVAVLVGVGAVGFAVPMLRVLLRSAFGPVLSVSGTVASSLMLIALPLAAMGLYGLATGAARVPDAPVRAWLRPPLAYLLVSLVLSTAAGLAAS